MRLELRLVDAGAQVVQDRADALLRDVDGAADALDLLRGLDAAQVVDDGADVADREIRVRLGDAAAHLVFRVGDGVQLALVEVEQQCLKRVAREQAADLPVEAVEVVDVAHAALLRRVRKVRHLAEIALQIRIGPLDEEPLLDLALELGQHQEPVRPVKAGHVVIVVVHAEGIVHVQRLLLGLAGKEEEQRIIRELFLQRGAMRDKNLCVHVYLSFPLTARRWPGRSDRRQSVRAGPP